MTRILSRLRLYRVLKYIQSYSLPNIWPNDETLDFFLWRYLIGPRIFSTLYTVYAGQLGKKVKEKRQRYSTKINIFLLKILKKKISAQDQLPKTEKNYTIKLLSVLRTTVIRSPMWQYTNQMVLLWWLTSTKSIVLCGCWIIFSSTMPKDISPRN